MAHRIQLNEHGLGASDIKDYLVLKRAMPHLTVDSLEKVREYLHVKLELRKKSGREISSGFQL